MAKTPEVYQRLKDAIGTGEVVGIVYHGGSQPGAYREIVPVKIDERFVRARCRTSGAAKMFNLDKIVIRTAPPGSNEATTTWSVDAPLTVELFTIAQIETAHRSALESIGWHIICVSDQHGDRLCLHRLTKDRSRPLKNPHLALRYCETTYDYEMDDSGAYRPARERPNSKPWSISGSFSAGGPWKYPEKAIEAFLREAATRF